MGLKEIFYLHKNKSQKFVHKEELNDATYNLILENNMADIELFNWVKKKCEMTVKEELTDKSILEFKTNNQNWLELIES